MEGTDETVPGVVSISVIPQRHQTRGKLFWTLQVSPSTNWLQWNNLSQGQMEQKNDS